MVYTIHKNDDPRVVYGISYTTKVKNVKEVVT